MDECQKVEPLFPAYVDGEAVSAERTAVDGHLERCSWCRHAVEAERTARRVLRARRGHLGPAAPDSLRARCAALRPRVTPARGRRLAVSQRWVPLSLAATLVLAVAGVFFFANQNVSALATQLTVDHMKCFRITGGTADADHEAAGSSWARTYGWTVGIPPTSRANELEFLGVRRCFVTEGRAAHLMYRWRGEPLSVFVLPHHVGDNRGVTEIVHRFGHEAVAWASANRHYVVVAAGRPPELAAVVQYVKANAR